MIKFLLSFIVLLLSVSLNGQAFDNRYNEEVFAGYTETSEVLFSTSVPQPLPGGGFYEWLTGWPLNVNEWESSSENLYMDIFEPSGDTLSKRPLVIICFGGGFLDGSKDHWSIRLLAQKLARRGYVTATIDYRLGMNIFDADLSMRAVYRGIQDGRSAVRFFRNDAAGANHYNIDEDRIFIGGHSSGAIIGLHNLYLDKESERPVATYAWTQDGNAVPDQGCLDCSGNNPSFSGEASACFSLAGALGFTSFVEQANDSTTVMFHSTDDGTVPYTSGQPFSTYLLFVVGDDLPDVYGSDSIAARFNDVNQEYDFRSYTNRGHGVHENGSNLYSDILPAINDWFFPGFLQPDSTSIQGAIHVCENELLQTYTVSKEDGMYWDWQVEGGVFTSMSPYDSTAHILWDPLALDKKIQVIPYNEIAARGDTITLQIEIHAPRTNIYIGNQTALWHDPLQWSLGSIPQPCDTIIIPNQAILTTIEVQNIDPVVIESIDCGDNVTLLMKPNVSFTIKD